MTCTYLQNIFTEIAILGFKKKVNVFWLHTYPLCVVSSLSDHCGGGGGEDISGFAQCNEIWRKKNKPPRITYSAVKQLFIDELYIYNSRTSSLKTRVDVSLVLMKVNSFFTWNGPDLRQGLTWFDIQDPKICANFFLLNEFLICKEGIQRFGS